MTTELSELLLASASEESWFSEEALDGGGSPWLLAKQEKESTKESTKTSHVLTMPRSGFREQRLQGYESSLRSRWVIRGQKADTCRMTYSRQGSS